MFIFDASPLIGIFSEARRPDLVDAILKLDPDLVVPSIVFERELKDRLVSLGVDRCIAEGKMRILGVSTEEMIIKFGSRVSKSIKKHVLGEFDVMVTYQKVVQESSSVRCVLDDGGGRSIASDLCIEHIGLLGLLDELADNGIMDRREIDDVKTALRDGGFRR